jgi:hypothetical protein
MNNSKIHIIALLSSKTNKLFEIKTLENLFAKSSFTLSVIDSMEKYKIFRIVNVAHILIV